MGNIVSSGSINACMEAAAKYGGPVIVTFSKGGGQFIAGKAADNTDDAASIAGAVYFKEHGEPLFSSHMLDLSEETLEENVGICKKYLERFAKCNVLLEMELGVTGGEEGGVDNSDVDS